MAVVYLLTPLVRSKTIRRKIEMSKFVYTTYEIVLVHLRAALRGGRFNHTQFIFEMKLTDDIIIDLCSLDDKFEKQYDKKNSHPSKLPV